ncbi:MAG: hypothetical protein AAGA48_22495 [Myxococcota bacterium]
MTEAWVWTRTDDELDALYRISVRPRVRWTQLVYGLTSPLVVLALPILWMPRSPFEAPEAWAVWGVGALVASALSVRRLGLRRQAAAARRHLERRGAGFVRELTIRREPWGLVFLADGNETQVAWTAVERVRDGAWWVLRHRGRAIGRLPHRPPVGTLTAPPEVPAPHPPDAPGTQSWTTGRAERAAWREAIGIGGWRSRLATGFLFLAAAGGAWLCLVAFFGPSVGVSILGATLMGSALLVGFQFGRASFPVPNGVVCHGHVGPAGIRTGWEGLESFTPWSHVRVWKEAGDYVFLGPTIGMWHMVPRAAIADFGKAEEWFRMAQPSNGEGSRSPMGPVLRDNPFEPPLSGD